MSKLAVIALGGNALLRDNQVGTIEEQEQNSTETLENIVFMIKEGYNIILSHGNGPQVGNILMRNDAGESLYGVAQMPLDVCVADSQGGIGYMIERMLRNVLKKHGLQRDILTIVTQVEIDKDDPAFSNPTKRVGKAYTAEEAKKLADQKSWIFKKSSKSEDAYRRVVPSPKPLRIFNTDTIEHIARQGVIVIAVGGGGIPVSIDSEGMVRAEEAVIDKDRASALLASTIKADELYILTDIPYIFINFKKENQEIKEFLDVKDAETYLEQGMFGEGSMAPKIEAAIDFVKKGGAKSVITEATKLADKKYGSKITLHYD
jgi:carbamate kinase